MLLTTLAIAAISPASTMAQTGDTLRLGAMQEAAARRDPRLRQLELLASQSSLRQRTLGAERLPVVSVDGLGQYQSDVTSLRARLPAGITIPTPAHDSYDARLGAQQRLLDPTLSPRRAVERAQLAQSEAQLRASLYGLRQEVNASFFGAALLQARAAELATALTDLEAQLELAERRVREGVALPGDAATVRAELLRRRQDLAQLAADRDAALAVLGDLIGRSLSADDTLALPDLAEAAARTRGAADSLRARPEYAQFASARELLSRQAGVVQAQTRPRVSAFGRVGYGRPALNFLADEFDSYWVAGVQLQWAPWNWGGTRREREVLALQTQIVATEEAAFRDRLRRGVARDLATMDRLERALATDDEIVALRDRILREARLRVGEGVITAAEYVDRQTDLLNARLARATHRVELAQARATYLTTLGIEVR